MDQISPQPVDNASLARPRHAWEAHYPADVDWGMTLATGPVPDLLDRTVAAWPDKIAIEYRERDISYRTLGMLVDRMAAGLIREGLGAGRTLALFLPNTPWHTVCFFGALKAGARLVHLSPLDAPRELAHKMMDSGADVVITTDLAGLGVGSVKFVEMGLAKLLFVGEDSYWGGGEAPVPPYGGQVRRLESLLAEELPAAWPVIDPETVALLQYTGGTTGMPKGAMLSHRNLTAATSIYSAWRDDETPEAGSQKIIGVLPMFHVYALGVILLLSIADGSEILLRPRFDVAATIRDIEEKRATSFPAVPTMLIAMLSEPGAATHDFSSLKVLGSGGAPMPHDVGQRVEALFNKRLRGGWGMTETSAAGSRIPITVQPRPGLIGVPLCNIDMRIVGLNDPRLIMGPGEVGEIAIRGPNIFSGYWNQDALNEQSFVDGFFLTGDIGTMDETGLFTIVDRKKRMIISGGFNVYPNMIESAIYEHPDVEEVIVIGIADEYRGEAAKAFIKLKADAAPMDLDGLRAFLKDRVGRHELPTALELRADLPKSPVGKLLANVLADEERARAKILRSKFMDLRYTAEEVAFRDEMRTFFREKIPADIRKKGAEGHHATKDEMVACQRIMNAHGLATPNWPVEWGGKAWSPMQRYIYTEELLSHDVPGPLPFNVAMVGPVIAFFGTDEQKKHYLPRAANLDDWWCQGFSEPGAGSDLASLKTRAVRDGDEWVINGQKTWTTLAQFADWIFVLARTNAEARKPQEGISFILVPMNLKGITVRPIQLVDGGHEVNEVFFDDVRVPVGNLVGTENRGWDCAKFLLANERSGIARVGTSKARLKRLRELARTVPVGDGTMWDSESFRHKISAVEIELKALEMTQLRVIANERARGGMPDPASSILKIKGSEIQQRTTELALELAGPFALPYHDLEDEMPDGANDLPEGFGWADTAAPTYFNMRKVTIYGGSNEIQRNIIAKMVLGF